MVPPEKQGIFTFFMNARDGEMEGFNMISTARAAATGALLVVATSGSLAEKPIEPLACQYVQVVDPCAKTLEIFSVDGAYHQHSIPLDEDEAGAYAPGVVDFATVPEFDANHSYVTQGPFLRVIDQQANLPWRTVDLREIPGLSDFWPLNLDAASAVPIEFVPHYPLYLVGGRGAEPWLVVLDQQALLAETLEPSSLVLASGPVCVDGIECEGAVMDIATSGFLVGGGGIQVAYASVLNWTGGTATQRFYRIDFYADPAFGVSLDPWNDEGLPYSGSYPTTLGVDYDGNGVQPFGVFQSSAVVADLISGETSCELPGDPTDVAVWGPNSDMEYPLFHFVTSAVSSEPGRLLGFPAGGCPDDSEGFLELEVAGLPQAVAVSSSASLKPWVFTANGEQGISAIHLSLTSAGPLGDQIRVLDDSEFAVPLEEGCPARLSIRDAEVLACAEFPLGEPKSPKVDCDEDPDDPRCVDPKTRVDLGEN
jgi:hypothetical protein